MAGVDDMKGRAKEALGALTGSDGLREEGQAQQKKVAEQERAEKARRVADEHDAKAEEHERAERDRQGT